MKPKKKPNMKGVAILIVDSDSCLVRAAIGNLRGMGFNDVTQTKSIDAAIKIIRSQLITMVITEWDFDEGGSGLDFIHYLRFDPQSPSRAVPVIMLTGRGELPDVLMARDAGATEFVIKPFSAQTLFNRLEQVIDHPRSFVISHAFTGPERRRRTDVREGSAERRSEKQYNVPFSRDAIRQAPRDTPLVLGPDNSMRETLGLNATTKLASLIPPTLLVEAQKAIDFLRDDSVTWIRQDIEQLNKTYAILSQFFSPPTFEKLKKITLSIKSRAGTFGHHLASDVARLLFLFLTRHFKPNNPAHMLVVQKHIEALTVIFAKEIKERTGMGSDLYVELERLVSVHKH